MNGRAILVVSTGPVHPSLAARRAFNGIVRRVAPLPPSFQTSTRSFRLIDPARHAAAAAFFHLRTIDPVDLMAVDEFVDAGGGLFALHGAIASFKEESRWAELLGAGFAGHDAPGPISVKPSETPGPFDGIQEFTVSDELYRLRIESQFEPHLVGALERGQGAWQQPVLWTRRHGEGRVCCCTLGHSARSLRQPEMQDIIARALAWVSGLEEAPSAA